MSPGVLFQVKMQESGAELVKPSQIVSLTHAVSGYSIRWLRWKLDPPGTREGARVDGKHIL